MDYPDPEALATVIEECFWGDYDFSPEEALERLRKGDEGFERFLAGRIVADSPFPSNRLRRLFPPERLPAILDSIAATGRAKRRLSLARAVILNEPWELEPSWIRG
jgi:hypothetical protein